MASITSNSQVAHSQVAHSQATNSEELAEEYPQITQADAARLCTQHGTTLDLYAAEDGREIYGPASMVDTANLLGWLGY